MAEINPCITKELLLPKKTLPLRPDFPIVIVNDINIRSMAKFQSKEQYYRIIFKLLPVFSATSFMLPTESQHLLSFKGIEHGNLPSDILM